MSYNPSNLYGPTIKGKPVFDKRFWKVKNHVQRMEAALWNSLSFKERFIIINGKMNDLQKQFEAENLKYSHPKPLHVSELETIIVIDIPALREEKQDAGRLI